MTNDLQITVITSDATKFAAASVPHTVDSNGTAAPIGSSNPQPVVAPSAEPLATISTISGKVYSSGACIGGQIPLSGGFVAGAAFASLRDLTVSVAGSQSTPAITATILRGSASTASTISDGSPTVIAAADQGKVIGAPVVLAGAVHPGAAAGSGVTGYEATGIDKIVPNGGYVVLTAGGPITVAAASGVTLGAGVA